jgi:hypothetical protein
VTRNLVPDGMKKYLDSNVKASNCQVTSLGNGGTVVYYLPRSGTSCIERFVDMEKQTCTCGLWERYRFPCHHAIASRCGTSGTSASEVCGKELSRVLSH